MTAGPCPECDTVWTIETDDGAECITCGAVFDR